MSLESFIPFVLATILILIIPGPTIILVISQAVTHGRKSVVPLVVGVLLGDLTAMTGSLLGLGMILSESAFLFSVFKWFGALYLLYLGLQMWRSNPKKHSDNSSGHKSPARSILLRSFIVTALNPKGIAFFVAFIPQFMDPLKPVLPQMTLLGGTFLFLAVCNSALFAIFAGQLSEQIRKERVRKWFNRCGGSALIGAAVITAGLQRSN